MDETFTDHEKRQLDKRLDADRTDYNNELQGNDVGRIKRFGIVKHDEADVKKRKNAETQSRLQVMLANEVYRAAFDRANQALVDAQNAVYAAYLQASSNLSKSKEAFELALENSQTLEDGRKVFLDDDGVIYTAEGEVLDETVLATTDWKEGGTTWAEFQRLEQDYKADQEQFDMVVGYQQRIDNINQTINGDENDPTSLEELETLTEELERVAPDIEKITGLDGSLKTSAQSPAQVPDLGL